MIPLLSAEGLLALRAFVTPGMLVALDYDGTLAALTSDPLHAPMRASTRDLLARVARRYRTLILTGRARQDALRYVGDVPGIEVIGNHGSETARGEHAADLERVAAWKLRLQDALAAHPGIVIEDKQQSLSVHYRQAPDQALAGAMIERVAGQLPGARLIGGKCVVNVVAQDAPDKGSALLEEMQRVDAPRALFAGDDTTDEHVFEITQPGRLLTVRVGADERSRARYFLPDQQAIDELLRRLVDAATAPDGGGDGIPGTRPAAGE
jgi:trehalose 6-phosphate phosphatase